MGILDYYLEEATQSVAVNCLLEVKNSLDRIAILGLQFREGKNETRECPMKQFPYTIVYRITARTVRGWFASCTSAAPTSTANPRSSPGKAQA